MSRVTNAILSNTAFARDAHQPMLDLTYGGQFGYAPDPAAWINNQAYVRRNLIPILMEAPRFFQLMPEPTKWVQTLKALVELHPRTIEGLNAGIELEFDEHPIGGAGEVQHEVVNSKRAPSTPTFTFIEKYGMTIQTFLWHWIQYGIMDPETKIALIGTLSGQKPEDSLADWFTMTCLFIEPDPTHRRVVKSWLIANMMPKGTGEIIGKRDLTESMEINTLSIEFTGFAQFNLGTNQLAQRILDSINITNANPYQRPAFLQNISADVAAAEKGYSSNVADLANSAIAPLS